MQSCFATFKSCCGWVLCDGPMSVKVIFLWEVYRRVRYGDQSRLAAALNLTVCLPFLVYLCRRLSWNSSYLCCMCKMLPRHRFALRSSQWSYWPQQRWTRRNSCSHPARRMRDRRVRGPKVISSSLAASSLTCRFFFCSITPTLHKNTFVARRNCSLPSTLYPLPRRRKKTASIFFSFFLSVFFFFKKKIEFSNGWFSDLEKKYSGPTESGKRSNFGKGKDDYFEESQTSMIVWQKP